MTNSISYHSNIIPAPSCFGVTLVDAHTRQPFQEVRGPDGTIHVLIEPEREYFVELQSTSTAPRFKAEIFVDGESLGYRYRSSQHSMKCGGTKLLGLRSVKGGANRLRALRFQRATGGKDSTNSNNHPVGEVCSHNNGTCDGGDDHMTVRVTFHSVDDDWEYKENAWKVLDMNWNGAGTEMKGSIFSSPGTIETVGPKRSSRLYKTGALLGSITLHYRTQEELIRVFYPNLNLKWSRSSGSFPSPTTTTSHVNVLSRRPHPTRSRTPTRRNRFASRCKITIE